MGFIGVMPNANSSFHTAFFWLESQVYDVLTAMLKYTSDIVTVSHTATPQGGAGSSSWGVTEAPPTVMVSTPTGLLHYLDKVRLQQQHTDLQLSLQMLVVDEADLLFAFGFEKDTRRLLQRLPSTASRHYQTVLVSATQNHEVQTDTCKGAITVATLNAQSESEERDSKLETALLIFPLLLSVCSLRSSKA